MKLDPQSVPANDNLLFAMHYLADLTPNAPYKAHRNFDRLLAAPLLPNPIVHANDPNPDRVLAVGYVSPDFSDHAVSFFLEPILQHHDRTQFEIYCYANVMKPDWVTARLRSICGEANWRDIRRLDDAELAEMIRHDRIDVLVDLRSTRPTTAC